MEFKNNKKVSLMIWEENPKMRNKNNEIKVNVKKPIVLQVGDVIKNGIEPNISNWEILQIIETRQSALSEYNYVTAKINWYYSDK